MGRFINFNFFDSFQNIVYNVIRPFYRNHYYQQFYKMEFAYFVEMAFELISAFWDFGHNVMGCLGKLNFTGDTKIWIKKELRWKYSAKYVLFNKKSFKNDFRKNPAIFTEKLFGISSLIIPWKYRQIYKATARKVKRGKGGWGLYPSVPGIIFHKIRRCWLVTSFKMAAILGFTKKSDICK